MPAPLQQPIAAPNRIISSSTSKDHYPYSTGMGSINNNLDRGGHGRQGAPANTTSNRNPNSMYNAMSLAWGKETSWLQEEQKIVDETATITTKTKKSAQSSSSSQRPVTPHGTRNKNFIERNKQFVQAVPKATVTKKSKEDAPSPSSSPKPKPSIVSTQTRPVTSGTNGQSSARPQAKPDKKKNDVVASVKVSPSPNTRRPASPPASPPASAAHSAHHSAHARSHTRASSPEKSLREENKKLKRRLFELEDWLREKEAEVLEYADIVDSYQERIRQVEARNRELQKENEFMRNHITEEIEKQKSCANEPTKIISSVVNNIQRIRGESGSPISSTAGSASSSPIPVSPLSSPKTSPVLTTSKSKELLKANNTKLVKDAPISPPIRPRVVPQTRGNLIPASKVVDVPTGNDHPPRPTAPSPAAMNRHEPSPFTGGMKRTEMLDRHAEMSRQASDRKQAAALNVVMEESEDSEVDEFIFEQEDTSDDQADSEFDVTSDEETSGNTNGMNDTEDDEDDQSDDDESEFNKWSTRASSKMDSIVEEDDDEEDDEFDYEPQQKKSSPVKNSLVVSTPKFDRKSFRNRRVDSEILDQKQKTSQDFNPHRDSMSSIKSNSSIDSSLSVLSSQNDSYPSSITSPSSTDYDISNYGSFTKSLNPVNSQQKLASSNGQSSSDLSNETSSKIMASNFACNPLTQSDNNGLNSSSTFKNGNNLLNGNSKRSTSPNSKQSNTRSMSPSTRASSPTSSTRASTPSSNASTARAPSPMSVTSSRASTPASESSRNANRRSRQNSTTSNSSSNKCSTAIPPPPPPPANKDPFATLQHYLRLISENSVMENPLKSYDLDKVIDEGSSAKVYTAHPTSNPSEECAIKVVPLSYSLEFIFNEIYVLKNLKHENIVEFKESFLRWDGKTREVWIAMEKCARGDVTNRAGKINQREVGRIAGDLLSALKHLHTHGIIHRDIKLSNILAGNNNEIKLADFGIASLTPTSTTAMVGTIPYMAPDVVLVGPDRPYDTKADIWSVGVCILELLTGKAAWGRIRDDEIMDKLRRGEMPYGFQRLRKKADIGWEAVDFLEKCFAKTPENRWSAEKLLEHPFVTGNRN